MVRPRITDAVRWDGVTHKQYACQTISGTLKFSERSDKMVTSACDTPHHALYCYPDNTLRTAYTDFPISVITLGLLTAYCSWVPRIEPWMPTAEGMGPHESRSGFGLVRRLDELLRALTVPGPSVLQSFGSIARAFSFARLNNTDSIGLVVGPQVEKGQSNFRETPLKLGLTHDRL